MTVNPRPNDPATTDREKALLNALARVVLETMDYPPIRRYCSDSHLPADYVAHAQNALAAYGLRIEADPHMMQGDAEPECKDCNGTGTARMPYSSEFGPCTACAALPSSTASATTELSANPTGSKA